jgi:hypothetical protein
MRGCNEGAAWAGSCVHGCHLSIRERGMVIGAENPTEIVESAQEVWNNWVVEGHVDCCKRRHSRMIHNYISAPNMH